MAGRPVRMHGNVAERRRPPRDNARAKERANMAPQAKLVGHNLTEKRLHDLVNHLYLS